MCLSQLEVERPLNKTAEDLNGGNYIIRVCMTKDRYTGKGKPWCWVIGEGEGESQETASPQPGGGRA